MRLIDLLRKLGILRFGFSRCVYRDARQRPDGLQMDGVLNPEKDLLRREDFTKRDANAERPG